jgi:hypothetical protein
MLCPRTLRAKACFSEPYKKNGQLRSGRQRAGARGRVCWGILKGPEMGCVGSRDDSWVGPLYASYRGLAIKVKLGTQA